MIDAGRRFFAVSGSDRRLVAEAAALLVLIRAGLRIVSFPTLQRLLDRRAKPRGGQTHISGRGSASEPVNRVAWAVSAVARRLPGRTTCLAEALAAVTMLRRRGHAPELRFGVQDRGNGSKPLAAHAWVECDGRSVIGELENQAEYTVLSATERS